MTRMDGAIAAITRRTEGCCAIRMPEFVWEALSEEQ